MIRKSLKFIAGIALSLMSAVPVLARAYSDLEGIPGKE